MQISCGQNGSEREPARTMHLAWFTDSRERRRNVCVRRRLCQVEWGTFRVSPQLWSTRPDCVTTMCRPVSKAVSRSGVRCPVTSSVCVFRRKINAPSSRVL